MTRVSKPPEERKGEILSTALELFLKNGYENTSVGDIVEKVGVAQGLFYYYFRTKEEVYRGAMERYAGECAARLIAIVREEGALFPKIGRALQFMEDLVASSEHALMDPARLAEHLDMDNRFSLHVAQALIEPLTATLAELSSAGKIRVGDPELRATFLIFGMFGLIHGSPDHDHNPAFFRADEVQRIFSGLLGLTPAELAEI